MTSSFREYLREAKKFLFLPELKVNNKLVIWNKQKSDNKFLSQINDRVKANHITDSKKLGEVIEKGLNLKYNLFADGKGRENDTCIYFRKSMFVVIFNMDEHSIIGIRNPNDDLRYKGQHIIFEDLNTTEYDDRLEKFCKDYLDIDSINVSEIYEGIKFDLPDDNFMKTIATNVCKCCIEVDL